MRQVNAIAEVTSHGQAAAALESGASEIYLNLEYSSLEELRRCQSLFQEAAGRLTAIIPRVISDKALEELLASLEGEDVKSVSVGNVGALGAARKRFKVSAEHWMNVYNTHALRFLKENGVDRAVPSLELNMKELRVLAKASKKIGIEIACLVHGEIELMTTRQCLVYNALGRGACGGCEKTSFYIRDEKGFKFPVRRDERCLNHIFNSRELRMEGYIDFLLKNGVSNLRFNLSFKDESHIRIVLAAYLRRVSLTRDDRTGFTRAHYFRGVA